MKQQLKTILQKNWHLLSSYLSSMHGNKESISKIDLCVNIDGGAVVNSSQLSMWPILGSIKQLPPKIRSSYKNMILAGIWVGKSKYDFKTDSFNYLKTIVNKFPTEIEFRGVIMKVNFLYLIADLSAKANILHMVQYNGYFGCTVCRTPGVHKNHRHLYISDSKYELRTDKSHQQDILSKTNGVTGLSVLHKLMKIPTGAPIDYMHRVCLGSVRSLYFYWKAFQMLKETDINKMSQIHLVLFDSELNKQASTVA
ncbi:uncharacterized protein LOC136089649 [Hydra vulgaris]|uniref:Uncharacterized protein LOC136089649 n=1 Tax=Hydra vulgaris TaxID=6087 RepID=A0ABM4DBN0_HYDVU